MELIDSVGLSEQLPKALYRISAPTFGFACGNFSKSQLVRSDQLCIAPPFRRIFNASMLLPREVFH